MSAGKGSARMFTRARIRLKADVGQGGPAWADTKIADALDVTEVNKWTWLYSHGFFTCRGLVRLRAVSVEGRQVSFLVRRRHKTSACSGFSSARSYRVVQAGGAMRHCRCPPAAIARLHPCDEEGLRRGTAHLRESASWRPARGRARVRAGSSPPQWTKGHCSVP